MKAKHRRLCYVALLLGVLAASTTLVLDAFSENIQFFYAPSDIAAKHPPVGKTMRVGGMVVPGSIVKDKQSLSVKFTLTDFAHQTAVEYHGALPDLFKENSGAVVIGKLRADGVFAGESVLAKHDENYMPPEVAKSLKIKPGESP